MAGINRALPSTTPEGQSEGRFGKGQGLLGIGRYTAGTGNWEPTVVYLIVLIIAEILLYGYLRVAFKSVHGG
jgi:hypothetical protein